MGMERFLRGFRDTAVSGGGGGGGVPTSRTITAGANLTGGGDLTTNRTLALLNAISLTGTTGNNSIKFPDNLAEAFFLGEATNRYLGFVTTNSSEAILFYKKISGYLANVNSQTLDYALVLTAGVGDSGKIVEMNSGSGKNVTLPATAPQGTCATITQMGAGQITFITTGSGTIVNASSQTKTRTQYSVCGAYCSSNSGGSAAVWVLSGDTGT